MISMRGAGSPIVAAAIASLVFCHLGGVSAEQAQQPLLDAKPKPRGQLHGRFLHITDFHPDPYFKPHSSTGSDSACHGGDGSAGYFGAETSDCDSPITLVNATFDWIADNLRDKIDFVIWTGDSARHDNDEEIPRSSKQVRELNEFMVTKFDEVFGRERDNDDPYDDYIVPIVPTLGNNDILPHNIFDIGPNDWTRVYLDIWGNFIPELERHEFDQSGWFAVQVIPGYLTAFSLNTLYFFDKNAAVDGCALKGEPGYRQMEWLRIQLQFLREKGQKAILVGHVPPARTDGKRNWDESCWQKYSLWMRQYRDVIVASFYGHMNVDHFILQDFEQIDPELDDGYGVDSMSNGENQDIHAYGAANYVTQLRASWASLPKKPKSVTKSVRASSLHQAPSNFADGARLFPETEQDLGETKKSGKKKNPGKERKYFESIGGEFAERFALSFVSPSIVPNYYPTLRVYEYNTTGVDYRPPTLDADRTDEDDEVNAEKKKKKKKKKDKKKKKQRKKRRFTVPKPPSKSSPPGPAYSPQSLSLLGYQQYFANLTYINNDFDEPSYAYEDGLSIDGGKWKDGKHGKHNGKKPNKGEGPDPRNLTFEVLYDTREDKIYKLDDLTVRSYVELAARMAKGITADSEAAESIATKKGKDEDKGKDRVNKAWVTFVRRAFVGTWTEQQVRQEFGDE